ncbi:UNVERIFIED_CONTAM: hypothetical protein Sangu_2909700 [Sesamum angustifolium]|uniref:Uncharacterized protein n=1 Tax=Sesamum angustifolium TaxID=2727405 RepID=A0AAW2ILW3_9LAMI
MDNNLEPGGAPDDIPMEIVELLAKNQRERALGNPRKHLLPEEINNSIRGSPAVYVDGRPGMTNFLSTTQEVVQLLVVAKRSWAGSPKFPPGKKLSVGYGPSGREPIQAFQLIYFGPTEKNTQYSATNSIISGPRPVKEQICYGLQGEKMFPFI